MVNEVIKVTFVNWPPCCFYVRQVSGIVRRIVCGRELSAAIVFPTFCRFWQPEEDSRGIETLPTRWRFTETDHGLIERFLDIQ